MKIGSMLLKVILALVVIIGISSCTKPGGTTVAQSNVDYYTCTMHPSVHSKTPGKCPICSMDLVPVLKKVANDSGPKDNSIEAGKGRPGAMTDNGSMGSMSMPSANQPPGNKPGEFSVPVERQQQIGVTYASAQIEKLPHDLKTAVLLFAYDNLSYAEIGEILGCTPKAVETRLYRVRKLLAKRLAAFF
jgi:hypothetical protein